MLRLFSLCGGRRYFLTFSCMITASILVYDKSITSEDYKTIIIGIVGVYVAGNVMQRIKAPESKD